jgi:hypothetical protein
MSFKKSISLGLRMTPASVVIVINQNSIVSMPEIIIKYMLQVFCHRGNKNKNRMANIESKNTKNAIGISRDFSTFFKELLSMRQLQGVS